MSNIDPELFQRWKTGHEAHNRFVLEERRRATYQERFASLVRIWERAASLGFMDARKPYDLSVNDTWQRLRAAYFERHG